MDETFKKCGLCERYILRSLWDLHNCVTGESSSLPPRSESVSVPGNGGKVVTCIKCKMKYRNSNLHICNKDKESRTKISESTSLFPRSESVKTPDNGGKVMICSKCKRKYRNTIPHICNNDKKKEFKISEIEKCIKCDKIYIKDHPPHACDTENESKKGTSSQIQCIIGELYFFLS